MHNLEHTSLQLFQVYAPLKYMMSVDINGRSKNLINIVVFLVFRFIVVFVKKNHIYIVYYQITYIQ
jgi:hypothetical protein